jgi:uncharacterized protein YciI
MTRWVAIFEDNPEEQAGWVRKQHAKDHFAYLEMNADAIKLAGGLRPSPEDWWNGGLWVMEVDTRQRAASLCENDPYFKLGLRKSYRLCVWGKAPFYGAVTL